MVATFLQDELVEELEQIFHGFFLKSPSGGMDKLHIFSQLLPMPLPDNQEDIPPEILENGFFEEQTAPDPYPYIIVQMNNGEIVDVNSAQIVELTLIIGIYDSDYQKQGHKDILNIIAKIYERFGKQPILNGKYTIQYPILWSLQDEESYPYYFGGMRLLFEIAAVRREDKFT